MGFPVASGQEGSSLSITDVCAVQETQETQVQSLGWEEPHSSILACRIPWTESISCKESSMTEATQHSTHICNTEGRTLGLLSTCTY